MSGSGEVVWVRCMFSTPQHIPGIFSLRFLPFREIRCLAPTELSCIASKKQIEEAHCGFFIVCISTKSGQCWEHSLVSLWTPPDRCGRNLKPPLLRAFACQDKKKYLSKFQVHLMDVGTSIKTPYL